MPRLPRLLFLGQFPQKRRRELGGTLWHVSYTSTRLLSRNEASHGCHRPLKLAAASRTPRGSSAIWQPRFAPLAGEAAAREGPGPRETPSRRPWAGDPAPSPARATWALATLPTGPRPARPSGPRPALGLEGPDPDPRPWAPARRPRPRPVPRGVPRRVAILNRPPCGSSPHRTGRGGPGPRGGAGRPDGPAAGPGARGMPGSAVLRAAGPSWRRARGLYFPGGCARAPADYTSQRAVREKPRPRPRDSALRMRAVATET